MAISHRRLETDSEIWYALQHKATDEQLQMWRLLTSDMIPSELTYAESLETL